MFPALGKAKRYEPQKLKGRHFEILRRHHLGQSNTEIAEALSITPVTVSYVVKSDLGQQQLRELTEAADLETIDAAHIIEETAPQAALLLQQVVTGDASLPSLTPALRLRAAESVLDRAGHGRITKIEAKVAHGYLIGLELIKQRAREAGILSGVVVETDAVSNPV